MAGQELSEFNATLGDDWWDWQNVRVGGKLVAHYWWAGAGSFANFVHLNCLGSTSKATDYSGATVMDEVRGPWGPEWLHSGSRYDEHFAGMSWHDYSADLDPTPNRMYSSTYGRWMSPDPLAGDVSNPQSLNRYAYVLNNPTNFVDPSGMGPCDSSNPPPFCSRAEAHVNDAISRLEGFADWEAMMMCFAEGSAVCDNPESGFSASISLGGISGGSSGPLSGDFGAGLGPPPTASSGMPCDFGACGGGAVLPGGNGFAAAAVGTVLAAGACVLAEPCGTYAILGGSAILTGTAIYWGYQIYQSRQAANQRENAEVSKYPPAKPGALVCEPLKAA